MRKPVCLSLVALLLSSCHRDIPNNAPLQPKINSPVSPVCGIKLVELIGVVTPYSQSSGNLPGYDSVKDGQVGVAYASSNSSKYVASIGVLDSTFSYHVNGSNVVVINKTSGSFNWYAAASVHDCY